MLDEIHKETAEGLAEYMEYNNLQCEKCKNDVEELKKLTNQEEKEDEQHFNKR